MTKSASASTRPTNLPRRRALKRGARVVQFKEPEHLRYLWAAYRKGWRAHFSPDLDAGEFAERALALVLKVYEGGGEVFVLEGESVLGRMPVGIVTMVYAIRPNQTPRAEPHIDWFPWATARNKLEAMLRLVLEVNRNFLLVTTVRQGDERLPRHLIRYGAVRQVGRFNTWFVDEPRRAFLFEGVRGTE